MSSLGGIFCRDGRSAERNSIASLEGAMRRMGPDGSRQVLDGPACLVHHKFTVLNEDAGDVQPIVGTSGIKVTWDGRLDNRSDLALQLGRRLVLESDASIVTAAYEQWEEKAFERLIGDWALAIWSSRHQSVILSRDFSGAVPLYYYIDDLHLMWCSELEGLVAQISSEGGQLHIDDTWVAGFFSRGADPSLTPYRSLRAVPPGHYIEVTRNGVVLKNHFSVHRDNRIRYCSDSQYEEHFRELFKASVASRLRARGNVWVQLSGGLDSSSVLTMAHNIVSSGETTNGIQAVSAIYEDARDSDESRFIGAVEEYLGTIGRHYSDKIYPPDPDPGYPYVPATPAYIDTFARRERAIVDDMRREDASVQLSGEGGDELLGNITTGVQELQDLATQFRWRNLPHRLFEWSRSSQKPVLGLSWEVVSGGLPLRMHQYYDNSESTRLRELMLTDSFKKATDFRSYLYSETDVYGMRSPSEIARSSALSSVIRKVATCPARRVGCPSVAFPILDRRLVSFLLSIPFEQLARPGDLRSLQRRALGAMLPNIVAKRRSKRSPDSAVYRALLANWSFVETLLKDPVSVDAGYIDSCGLRVASERVRIGTFPATLFRVFLLFEQWLRTVPVFTPKRNPVEAVASTSY